MTKDYPGKECGLSKEEWEFELHVDKIRELPTLEAIGYLRKILREEQLAPSGWISVKDRLPELKEGEDFSENVFALVNSKLMVMAYCWIDCDEDSGYAWCNCNGDINGDPEFDDDYKVTHWQPFPEALEPKPQKQ